MPNLLPLVKAASLAYEDVREYKDASLVYKTASSLAGMVGYPDTSADKRRALNKLADAEVKGDEEAVNKALLSGIGGLQALSKDGSNFKIIVDILSQCADMVTSPQTAKPAESYFQFKKQLKNLNPVLVAGHSLYQALEDFTVEMEKVCTASRNAWRNHYLQGADQLQRARDATAETQARAKEVEAQKDKLFTAEIAENLKLKEELGKKTAEIADLRLRMSPLSAKHLSMLKYQRKTCVDEDKSYADIASGTKKLSASTSRFVGTSGATPAVKEAANQAGQSQLPQPGKSKKA